MYDYEYRRASSLEEATALITAAEDSRLLAGGMSLVPAMKHRLTRVSRLVDINAVPGLSFIERTADGIDIGAMTRHESVARSEVVTQRVPGLAVLAGGIGDVQVRHRGTIGGSISNNDPGACYPSAVLGLGATVHTTRRRVESDAFFTGMFSTALEPGEIVTKVSFPIPRDSAYVKFHNLASRFSIVGVFLARFDRVVRVAVTGAGPCVFRVSEFEARLSERFSPQALSDAVVSPDNLISDLHGSAEYRAYLIPILTRRAVEQCLASRS